MDSINQIKFIIKRLRSPSGCPWDQKQTIPSLIEHLDKSFQLIKKKHGPLHAKERSDIYAQLLYFMIFFFELVEESGEGSIEDIATRCKEMVMAQHPHLFNGVRVNMGDVVELWERIKKRA